MVNKRVICLAGVVVPIGWFVVGTELPSQEHRQQPRDTAPIASDCVQGGQRQSTLAIEHAESFTAQNTLFDSREGWIGADGAHSVELSQNRILWLFSDTWVGSICEGRRTDATIVNNSVAVQDGRGDSATVRFVIRKGGDGIPKAFVAPADGSGWFWLQAGLVANGKLLLFLTQVEKTGDAGVFGFHQIGQWLGIIDNPQDDPLTWRIEQRKIPHALFTKTREVTFGAATLKHDAHIYIFGTDEDVLPKSRDRHLILARAPAATVGDFGAWEFFHDGSWHSDFRKASRLVPEMASDCSVTYLSDRRQFVLVYTERGLSERILARAAPEPWGPWSEPLTVYHCPEVKWDRRIFCYNAKAHGALSSPDELIVSYIANSYEFWHVAADARLYWPRFVRIRLPIGTNGDHGDDKTAEPLSAPALDHDSGLP